MPAAAAWVDCHEVDSRQKTEGRLETAGRTVFVRPAGCKCQPAFFSLPSVYADRRRSSGLPSTQTVPGPPRPCAISGHPLEECDEHAASARRCSPATLAFSGRGLAQEPPDLRRTPDAQTPGRRRRPRRAARRSRRSGPTTASSPRRRSPTRASSRSTGSRTVFITRFPRTRSAREFLWVSQIAKTTMGAGYGGQAAGNRVVKWERRGDRILLRGISYEVVADPTTPISKAVQAANYDSILMAFNIEALGKNEAPVIEVTRLFTTDVPEFSGRTRVRARTFDTSRSFVERAVSFPENVEVEATHTYNNPPDQAGRRCSSRTRRARRGAGARRQLQRRHALQHGAAAGEADAAAAVRRAGRLLLRCADGLRQGRASRAGAPLHHALPARKEGSERRTVGAGEADRLLHRPRDADQVGAILEEGQSRAGRRRSRQPDSRTRSSRKTRRRRRRIRTGAPRTRATPSSDGCRRRRRTPRARTSTTRAPARSSSRTSSSITTS